MGFLSRILHNETLCHASGKGNKPKNIIWLKSTSYDSKQMHYAKSIKIWCTFSDTRFSIVKLNQLIEYLWKFDWLVTKSLPLAKVPGSQLHRISCVHPCHLRCKKKHHQLGTWNIWKPARIQLSTSVGMKQECPPPPSIMRKNRSSANPNPNYKCFLLRCDFL